LIFQVLDNKKECAGIYLNGDIHKLITDPKGLSRTWAPSEHFVGAAVEYASVRSLGATLDEACPEALKGHWRHLSDKAKSFFDSFATAKIDLDDICFYDLVPKKFLLEFFELKNKITEHAFNEYTRPVNYDFLHDLSLFLTDIKSRPLNIDLNNLKMSDNKVRNGINKIRGCNNKIVYNQWRTVTGRLTTETRSFPILTLNKELRSAIKPQNDCFVELDYNAAELRVLFGLLDQEQPETDVHDWINTNIFKNKYGRETSKKKVFSWLYNPKAKNKKLNEYLNRDLLFNKYYVDGIIHTPFGRKISSPEDKVVSYLVQSTTSDMFLTSAIKINKILKERKSSVCFCIHDSLVIDLCLGEKNIINDLVDEFSQSRFGKLKTNLSIGKDFGQMRKVL